MEGMTESPQYSQFLRDIALVPWKKFSPETLGLARSITKLTALSLLAFSVIVIFSSWCWIGAETNHVLVNLP